MYIERNAMLLVQEYLLTHSIAALYRDHGVKCRIASERNYKMSLNYDQLEAVDSDELSQECRGLVLRTVDGSPMSQDGVVGETCVMARPFDRFFNCGMGAAANVNLDAADTVLENKYDGTCCIVYFDDIQSAWHVATRAVCEADLPLNGWDMTFRDLFEKTLACDFALWSEKLDRSMTYVFELCAGANQVVVQHKTDYIVLLGVRETLTGREYWPATSSILGVKSIETYRLGSVAEITEFVQGRDPREFEGIVACQEVSPGVFNRVKIKSAQYMAYSRLKDAVASPRNVMTLILGEKLDDAFVVMSDDMKVSATKMQDGVRAMLKDYRVKYDEVSALVAEATSEPWGSAAHRKAFARSAHQSGIWFDPAMMQYAGKCSGISGYIEAKRGVSGGWTASFLDSILSLAKRS